MSRADTSASAYADVPPELRITVDRVAAEPYAVTPTLGFRARIEVSDDRPIQSIALHAQIRIAAGARPYDEESQRRLVELFGAPAEWARSLRSLLWTRADVHVPAFAGSTTVTIPASCTYDFEVAAAKYLHALASGPTTQEGTAPLEFLFSGAVFATVSGALRVTQIPWDTDAEFSLPARVWKDLMDRHFPHTAWLRLDRDTFDRLYAFKARHTFATWEDAVEALLRASGSQLESDGVRVGGPDG